MESLSNRGKKEGETVNLWTELLSQTIKNEEKDSNVLVIGNYDSGKKTLVSSLQKVLGFKVVIEPRNESSVIYSMKDKKNVGAFDFSYISIKNPADESIELGKINFWSVDEQIADEIINQILTAKRLSSFAVLVCLDFEQVSQVDESLDRWLTFVNQKVAPIFFKLFDLKSMDGFKAKMTDLVMNYTEPITTQEGKVINRKVEADPELADKLYVPEGVLQPNYGFPIFICLNKSDHILELRRERNPDEILDMIECTLRKRAFPYAAAVFYTSTKMDTNMRVLADYLKFVFFKIPFEHAFNPAKDSLFIPIGYDNADIVRTAYGEVMDKIFGAVVPRKEEQTKQTDREFVIKTNQKFLEELKELTANSIPQSSRNLETSSISGSTLGQSSMNVAGSQAGAQDGGRGVRFSREYRERIMNVLNKNPSNAQSVQINGTGVNLQNGNPPPPTPPAPSS